MAKKAKVPLNVLVVEGTRAAIRELADTLECSQGTVVDRAIVLLAANHNVAKGLQGISLPTPINDAPPARELLVELDGEGEK